MPRRNPSRAHPLPKSDIIKSSREIGGLLRKGKRYNGSFITVFCSSHPPQEAKTELRVAFTVSSKVRRAVDRNRLKRLMREAYRLHREEVASAFGNSKPSSIVISCSHGIPVATLSLKDIEKDFEQFLRRVSSDIAG